MRLKLELFILVLLLSLSVSYTSNYVQPEFTAVNQETVSISVPSDFEDHYERQWATIANFILTSNYKIYILNWAGYGGSVDTGNRFISNLIRAKKQGKHIIFNLVGDSWSMHSLVVCYADEIYNFDKFFLMFHAPAIYTPVGERTVPRRGSGINSDLNTCMERNIITNEDIDRIFDHTEVYVKKNSKWYNKDPRT